MRKAIIILILLNSAFLSYAQRDEKIIKEISGNLFDPQADTLFLERRIYRTYFDDDSTSFYNETGLTVPKKIISDWRKNVESDSFSCTWIESELNKRDTIINFNDTVITIIPLFVCLSEKDIKLLFDKTKKRQNIVSISKILYDDSGENALFDLTYIPWPGDFYSQRIFIKKIFGKWIIVQRFNFMMT